MSAQLEPVSIVPAVDFERLREAREILQAGANAINSISRHLDTRFSQAVDQILNLSGAVVVCGMGKAGLIGRKLAATLSSTGTRAFFMHPAEAVHGDLGMLREGDLLLALSNSGETEELCQLLPFVKQKQVPIIAITARETNTLARLSDLVLAYGNHREAGVLGLAPTTSTTSMLALGDALALVVSRWRGFSREQFAQLHPGGALGRKLTAVSDVMRSGDQLRIAPETSTIREALVDLRKSGRRTGAVMAVDETGILTGLFTDSDLVRLLEQHREQQLDRPLIEVMTHQPKTVTADAPLADACAVLAQYQISELPVIDEQHHPIGLVDITDVISLLPEERPE